MKYYLDITLLPDIDITLGFLWQKIYQQVHIALVDNKVGSNESSIAIGFPNYGDKAFPLGNKLRLLANDEAELTTLNIKKWLNRFEDYVHIKPIKLVPDKVTYVAFIRQYVKGDARIQKDMLDKALYWSEKSGQPIENCLQDLEKSKPKVNNQLPFIWLESQKTKQRNFNESRKFPLFIKKIELSTEQLGLFNCYGLSKIDNNKAKLASIPQF